MHIGLSKNHGAGFFPFFYAPACASAWAGEVKAGPERFLVAVQIYFVLDSDGDAVKDTQRPASLPSLRRCFGSSKDSSFLECEKGYLVLWVTGDELKKRPRYSSWREFAFLICRLILGDAVITIGKLFRSSFHELIQAFQVEFALNIIRDRNNGRIITPLDFV